MILLLAQQAILEFLWDILYFPIWWYTRGVLLAGRVCLDLLKSGNDLLIPFLWARNLFVPMFGQRDWQGRITSFFIRFANIIIRSMLLLVWLLVVIALFALWLSAPMIIVVMLRR